MDWLDKLLGRAFPVSQTSEGDQSPNIVAQQVTVSYGGEVPAPPLQMLVFPLSPLTRMHFRAQRVPFDGHAAELEKLQSFLDSERPFSWWLVTGAGGSGKSRLALELCLRRKDTFKVGFLPEKSGYDRWSEWKPEQPTLIVADYCSLRSLELQNIVDALATHAPPVQHRVRLLLLERSTEGQWWKDFLGVGSTRLLIESVSYAEPLQLSEMSDRELWQAIAFLLEQSGVGTLPDKEETIQALNAIDPLRRPLFAALAADALIVGRDIRSWDQRALLRDVFEREEDKFWKPAGVTERDKNLLCFATIVCGMQVKDLEIHVLSDEAILPSTDTADPERFNAARYQSMTGQLATQFLMPLKPDVIGEFFVLERLLPRDEADTKRGLMTLVLAWLARPDGTFDFTSRVFADFPAHPAVRLIDLSLRKPVIEIVADLFKDNDDRKNGAVLMLAAAKSNLALASSRRGMMDEALSHCFELFQMSDQWPSIENVALATVPLVCGSSPSGSSTYSPHGIFQWVGKRWTEKGSQTEQLQLLTQGTLMIAGTRVEEGLLDQSLTLCRELVRFFESFATVGLQFGVLAEGIRRVVVLLLEAKEHAKAKEVFDLLAGLRGHSDGDRKFTVNWALAGLMMVIDARTDPRGEEGLPDALEVFESIRPTIQSPEFKDMISAEIQPEHAAQLIDAVGQISKAFADLDAE